MRPAMLRRCALRPMLRPNSAHYCSTAPSVLSAPETPEEVEFTPRRTVEELDQFIIGQGDGKRALAIAFRNRWRRKQIEDAQMMEEVSPRNILLVGPTGCGKTELARRMAKMLKAPFVKAEATKFTEVGYVGRDVDNIIEQLVEVSISATKKQWRQELAEELKGKVEDEILNRLVGPDSVDETREEFRKLLREGALDDQEIDVELPSPPPEENVGGRASPFLIVQAAMNNTMGNTQQKKVKMTVKESLVVIEEQKANELMDQAAITRRAIKTAETDGIVFIDEIDKIIEGGHMRKGDPSTVGVQRDLLPLIEGSATTTKYGLVNTDHMLFIAAGAFHDTKPSGLMPELQGRLPIRVELKALTEDELFRILQEPKCSMLRQHEAMFKAENATLTFTEAAVRMMARRAHEMNAEVENIGARRLHTVIEKVMEKVSFEIPEQEDKNVLIDASDVDEQLEGYHGSTDLKRFIL